VPDGGLRSPAALFGVLAVHAAVAWALSHVLLHPERLPEPLLVALLPEPPPDVQPQPLPMAEVPPAPPRRMPVPRPQTVQPEPEPQPQVPEPVTAAALEPLPMPTPPAEIEPAPRPDPQPVVREAPPMPSPPVMAVAPPPPQPAPVIQAPAPAPAAAEPTATQPLYSADYLRNPKPRYPLVSRRMGEEGLVTLRVYVTSAGEPRQVQLKESCGFPRLDQAAQEVVWNWRFVPARRGDSPVDAWVVVPIRFTLKG